MAFRSTTRHSTVRRSSYRPRLEALEERCVPSAGDLDTAFGTGGTVTYSFGGINGLNELALQSDGKIIAVGEAPTPNAQGGQDFATIRFNSNGTLDTLFGSGGTVRTDFNKQHDWIEAVGFQSDGKIIVAGSAVNSQATRNSFALARYNTNG